MPLTILVVGTRLGPNSEEEALDSKLGPDFGSEPEQVG